MPTKTKNNKGDLLTALRGEDRRIPQPGPAVTEIAGDRKVLNFRLEAEVIYQLKLLALQERKPVQSLLCEGVNEVFGKRGMPPIAK